MLDQFRLRAIRMRRSISAEILDGELASDFDAAGSALSELGSPFAGARLFPTEAVSRLSN